METYATESTNELVPIPASMPGDMKLVAWLQIIQGGLMCLSIIGAIIGIPMLISGLRLKEAAEEFEQYDQTGSLSSIMKGIERQSRYFFIMKVFIIIALAVWALSMIFVFTMIGTGAFMGMMNGGSSGY